MAFDVAGARKAGYSDTEIADHLATSRDFDVSGARKAGYSDAEITDYLSGVAPKPTTMERIKALPGQAVDNLISAIPGMGKEEVPAQPSQSAPTLTPVEPTAQDSALYAKVKQANPSASDADIASKMTDIARQQQVQKTPAPASAPVSQVKPFDFGALNGAKPAAPDIPLPTTANVVDSIRVPDAATQRPGPTVDAYRQRRTAELRQQIPQADDQTIKNIVDGEVANSQLSDVGTVSNSNFDFETHQKYKDSGTIERGAVKGVNALEQSAAGMHEFIGDMLGAEGYKNAMADTGNKLGREADAIGDRSQYLTRNWEGAVSSIVSQTPGLAVSALSGGSVPLLLMGMQQFGGDYHDGRAAGLDKQDATTRAAVNGVAEIIGEKIGMPSFTKVFKDITHGVPTDELIKHLAEHIIKEVPGEELTTAIEFANDKFPGYGQNKQANLQDYLKQAADTLVQTVMQAGAMGATGVAGSAVHARREQSATVAADVAKDNAMVAWEKAFPKSVPEAEPAPVTPTRIKQVKQEIEARKDALRGQFSVPVKPPVEKEQPADELNQDQLLSELGGSGEQNTESDSQPELTSTGDTQPPAENKGVGFKEAFGSLSDGGTTADLYRKAFDSLSSGKNTIAGVKDTILTRAKAAFDAGLIKSPDDIRNFEQSGYPSAKSPSIDEAAHAAATSPLNEKPEPTEAQKLAGNYSKGHVTLHGLDISIENPAGSTRSGTDEDGKAWETTLANHYGYVKRTTGADGDQVDVFIGDKPESQRVFVVDQINPKTGAFDEHKALLGFDNQQAALDAYHANYQRGWRGASHITDMSVDQFKDWLKNGDTTKPMAKEANATQAQQVAAQAGKKEGAQGLSIGSTPNNAEPVTVKNGVVHVGKYPAMHFETGEDVTVPAGADNAAIAQALRDSGVLSNRQRIYGLPKAEKRSAAPKPEAPAVPESNVAQIKQQATKAKNRRAAASIRTADELAAQSRKTFLKAIKDMGGIKSADAADVSGEPAHVANRLAPGLFRKEGNAIDLIARRLHELGYLSDAHYNDVDGGAQAARDLIGQALSGEAVMTPAEQERYNDLEAKERELSEAMPARNEALADMIEAETEGYDDGLDLDTLPSMSEDEAMRALGFTEDEINGKPDTQESGAQATEGAVEIGAHEGAAAGAGQEGQAGFALEVQSPAEVKAAEAKKQADAEAKAKADAAAEAKAKADSERDSFTLTGSSRASDANPNQGDIFEQPKSQNDATDVHKQGINPDDDENAPQWAGAYDVVKKDGAPRGFMLLGKNPDGDPVYEAGGIRAVVSGDYVVQELAHKPKNDRIAEFKTVDELRGHSRNAVFTEDAATAARALLKKKLSGQLNSGIDPEVMQAGITLAGYHIEKGARSFAAYAKAMIDDMGEAVKPYLKSWYAAVSLDPRAAGLNGMDSLADVQAIDVDNLGDQRPATWKQQREKSTSSADYELDAAVRRATDMRGWVSDPKTGNAFKTIKAAETLQAKLPREEGELGVFKEGDGYYLRPLSTDTGIGAVERGWVDQEAAQRRMDARSGVEGQDQPADLGSQTAPEYAPGNESEPATEGANDRDHFTLERMNKESGYMEPVTFARGEYVRYTLAGKDVFGEIDGISHARREFSVDGLWYPFGFAYKAEKPAEIEKQTVPLSSVIDAANKKHGADLNYADRIYTPAVHEDLFSRIVKGEVSADEFKASFEALLKNKDGITAELSALTKNELLKRFPGISYRYKNEKKADAVAASYRDMVSDFALGNSISYTMDFSGKGDRYTEAVKAMVERTTDESLAQYAADIKQARDERAAARAEALAGMENPQTLEDYNRMLRARREEMGGATFTELRMSLTPEQRAQFDILAAEKSRGERGNRRDDERTRVSAAGTTTGAEIIATKHTRDGYDLFVVKAAERVERDVYNAWNAAAKKLGGWYSSFKGNGAVPGFQFKDRASAEAFQKYVSGNDTQAVQEQAKARRDAFADDRSQTAVERLNEMADSLEARADASLGQERKANTARRASMAARAEAAANAEKAMAQTMRNIASAISEGRAKFLDRIRQKVQVELLQGIVTTAQYEKLRKLYPSYADYERHQGERPDAETADYVEFPSYTAYRSDLASLGRALLETEGTKKLGQQIMRVADDVTETYLTFARENLDKVAAFSKKGGDRAVFSSKGDAEEAIARSGYKGAAIVLPFKRGQNIIVLSPSEAVKRGIWGGDNDKRITLSIDFGSELVEKLNKVNIKRILNAPWQFENAYDKLKRLAGMGIETPAELRAAVREFIGLREAPKEADKIKEIERSMIGRRNDGLDFFPTPASVADEMIGAAGLEEGMRVLEPSAGMGHIAEQIREAGVDPDVVELSGDRRELLEAKGFNVVGRDFMDVSEGGYDRILMNPPFSDGRAAQHVQHAYELLKPGGRLVALMDEGVFYRSDKKAQAFRDWMEQVGATDEKLEEGTFLDPSLPVNTGVSARMVVIQKDGNDTDFSFGRTESTRDARPVSQMELNAVIERVTAKWERPKGDGIRLIAVDGVDGLPVSILRSAAAQNVPAEQIKGVFHKGHIYLVRSNLKNARDAEETIFHEAYGHFGARLYFGPDSLAVEKAMLSIWKRVGDLDGVRNMAQRFGVDKSIEGYIQSLSKSNMSAIAKQRVIVDELLAHVAGRGDFTLADQLKSYVGALRVALRNAAKAMGLDRVAEALGKYTDSELLWNLKGMRDAIVSGKTGKGDGTLFARTDPGNNDTSFARTTQTPPPGGVSASVPSETKLRKAQRVYQDQFNRFTVIQEWLRDNGVKLGNKHDVYRAEERMYGKIAAQIEDFRAKRLQPLVVSIHKAGFNMGQIGEYLAANHAAERNAQIAKINPDAVDDNGNPNGSGMTDAEAQAVLAKYAGLHNFANFEKLAEEFRAITDDTKQTLLDAGIISKEMADAWDAAYQHYVPLRGGPADPTQGQATGKGLSVNGRSERRRAMGHQARDEWVVENIIHAHERAIYLAEKNRVGQYLVSLAAAVPDSRLWTIDKPVKRKVLQPGQASFVVTHQGNMVGSFDTRHEADLFVTAIVTSANKTPSDFVVSKTLGDPQVAYMANGSLADNEVQVYVKGNTVRIQLNDPLLARAYKKMGQVHLVGILELGRQVNAFLSKAYTGLNPEFIVTNMQRDLISGLMNVTGEEGSGIAAKTIKNWLPSLRDMMRYSLTGEASDWVRMYREDGGNTGAAYLSDLERIGKDVQTAYEEAVGVRQLFRENKPGKAVNVALKKSLHLVTAWIEHLNAAAENGMRVALYRSMVEAGKGRAAAAAAAKNSTVNFNRKGEIGSQLSALYLFANPSIQGAASMGHSLFKGKHKGQAWVMMGALAGLAYMLALGYGDDDEWDEVPQYEKDHNLLMRIGDKVVKIAVPYGQGVAFALGNAIYDMQRGKDPVEESYHMASSILENLAPLNPLGDKPDLKFALTELVPFEPLRIFARVANNTTGFGGQIMPESKFDEARPDFLKEYRNTHGSVYDQLTRGMSKATGGTATQAGAIDVSPETLKFLWESATGGTGRFFIDSVQAARLASEGSLPELKETPMVRKFVRDANRASDARTRFWDAVNRADTVLQDFHRASQGKDFAAADRFQGMQLGGLSRVVDSYKNVSIQARDAVAEINSMDNKTPAEKRLMTFEVEKRERELYRAMVKDINRRIGEKHP